MHESPKPPETESRTATAPETVIDSSPPSPPGGDLESGSTGTVTARSGNRAANLLPASIASSAAKVLLGTGTSPTPGTDVASIQKNKNLPGSGIAETGYRPARPVQSSKASYPALALRMGLEADVTLRVSVAADGAVKDVEVVKSAGMGFDEEAIRAVRQFRFEPAKNDGQAVPSEFVYIYRFRLTKR
ncbi:MAG: TonB family protein [Deltaproteobacteria bacterium]|nr:TonB family protein [Deltaproteobacteria bacterium]